MICNITEFPGGVEGVGQLWQIRFGLFLVILLILEEHINFLFVIVPYNIYTDSILIN
jgi:hypothetical protein